MIVGPSGCAKSVLLRLHFGWPADLSATVWCRTHADTPSILSVLTDLPALDEAHSEQKDWLRRKRIQQVEEALRAVGLCVRQHRLDRVRYAQLSQGERHLCDIAYLLIACQLRRPPASGNETLRQQSDDGGWQPGKGVLLIDEFTSCLDRETARQLGRGLSTYCRTHAAALPVVVVAGCHADVVDGTDGFAPDWVFEADTMTLLQLSPTRTDHKGCCATTTGSHGTPEEEHGKALLEVPSIELRLRACDPSEWRVYRAHHYKTQTLSPKARTFALTLEMLMMEPRESSGGAGSGEVFGGAAGSAVGFVATIPQSGGGVSDTAPPGNSEESNTAWQQQRSPRPGGGWRAHRTVVLPAWQGLGIGGRLSDAAAALHQWAGCDYYGQTVHPRFGAYRDSSPLWRGTLWNHSMQRFKIESWSGFPASFSCCFKGRFGFVAQLLLSCLLTFDAIWRIRKQRTANTRVRLRTPRYVYSHYFLGAEEVQAYKQTAPQLRCSRDGFE